MDPRVKITPEVQQIFTLTTRMEANARNAAIAYKEAQALAEKLKANPQSAANDARIKQVEEIAPPLAVPGVSEETAGRAGGRGGRGGGGRGGRGAAAPAAGDAAEAPAGPNLSTISAQMIAAVMGMQGAEMPPTATALQACTREEAAYTSLMAKWSAVKARVGGGGAAGGKPAAGDKK